MRKSPDLDFTAHYESILSLEKDSGKIKAADFLNCISDLILKYSKTIEKGSINESGN